MQLHERRLLGCRLLTDTKKLADVLTEATTSDPYVGPIVVDCEFPGVVEAAVEAIAELGDRNLESETLVYIDHMMQAVTSADFGPQASDRRPVSLNLRALPRETLIETIAAACHLQNRAWCVAHGDDSQPFWLDAPAWAKDSAISGVKAALAGATPEESHQGWLKQKEADGWVYGELKDVEKKTHRCMVPYDQLPPEQQMKDHFFTDMVRELGHVLGLIR